MNTPVAWDVNARLDIKVDSINVGYFLSLRNPSNGQLLFPGLTVESQNVQISAGHDLIVSPIPAEEGFGYALSVGYKQKAVLSADNQIILKEPGIGMVSSYYDKISIGLQDYAEATLNARQILLYGGIEAQYGSSLQLTASEGIYILNGHEKALGASAPIRLTDAKMEADAPNIFVNHEIQIGQNILGYNLKGFLYIGQNSQSGIKTNSVFFNQKVSAERDSELRINAANTIIFQQPLNLIGNAQANISSNQIELFKLFLGNEGAHARFQVTPQGYMYAHDPISVSTGLTYSRDPFSLLSLTPIGTAILASI